MIEVKRTVEDVERTEEAQWAKEIEDARKGLRADISRKAAASYLGIHHTNLSKLRTSGTGPASVQARGKGRNTGVTYRLADLDAWKDGNRSTTYNESVLKGRAQELQNANTVSELKLLVAELEAANRSLRDRLRKNGLAFATALDVAQPSEWVVDQDGYIQGHILTVDDAALVDAIQHDRIDEMPVVDALQRPWSSMDQQGMFAEEVTHALEATNHQIALHLDAGRSRQQLRDELGLNN